MSRTSTRVILDDIEATVQEHADRLGVHRSRVYQRVRQTKNEQRRIHVTVYSADPDALEAKLDMIARARGLFATTGRKTGEPNRSAVLEMLVDEELARGVRRHSRSKARGTPGPYQPPARTPRRGATP